MLPGRTKGYSNKRWRCVLWMQQSLKSNFELFSAKWLTICFNVLTHWGRVTDICVGNLTTIGSDNGMSPDRRLAIIWTNAKILLIGSLGTNFSEILAEIHTISFKKMHYKMSSRKWAILSRPQCVNTHPVSCKPDIIAVVGGCCTHNFRPLCFSIAMGLRNFLTIYQ